MDLLKMARPLTPTELRPHRRPYLIALGTPGVVTPTALQDYYDAWLGLKVETLNLVSVHDAEGRLLLGVEYALERVSRIRIADGSEWKFSFVFADDRPNDAIEILITAPSGAATRIDRRGRAAARKGCFAAPSHSGRSSRDVRDATER